MTGADLYHLSKAVYSGDLSTAQAVLDKMRAKDFSVLRGRMAAGIAMSSEALPVDTEVQARLDALMAKDDDKIVAAHASIRNRSSTMFNQPRSKTK